MSKQEIDGNGWKFPESYDKVMDYVDKTDPNLLYCFLLAPWVTFYWNVVSSYLILKINSIMLP